MVQVQIPPPSRISRREVLEQGCCPTPPQWTPPQPAGEAAQLFRALADDTRLQIVWLLAGQQESLCVCYIEAAFTLSQPTISHHLKVLREAGLVTAERRGVWIYYTLDSERLKAASDLLSIAADPERLQEGEIDA